MRTSPLGMRRRLRRAPLLLSILALVVALGAACSDDGGDDEGTNPTTTSPSTTAPDEGDGDEGTTTSSEPDDSSTTTADPADPEAVPGDEVDVLTADQAQAQMEALLAAYRQGVAEAAASGTLDERTLAAFSGAFTGQRAGTELDALQQAGVEILNPEPPEVTVAEVEVTSATAGCAAGTATIEGISGFVTTPVDTVQPYYFRLVPAPEGSAAPAWRLSFLNWSNNGEPLAEATCE